MKKQLVALLLVVTFCFFGPPLAPLGANGSVVQKKVKIIAYPGKKYIKREGFGYANDWVVEITVPEDASASTPYCECDRSQRPFVGTSITETKERGVRLFQFVAGRRAQVASAYSFEEWARVWRVSYYYAVGPRGPATGPRRP